MSRLIDLYPRTWRDRYGAEFAALLAERPPNLRDRIDIVRGALDARRHPQIPGSGRRHDRYGFAPLAGFGLLSLAVIVAANGTLETDSYGTYRDGAAAMPLLFLAAILLSVGLGRVVERLPVGSDGPLFAGWIAIVVGPVWAMMPWLMPLGLTFFLGLLGLAVGARRAGIWPAWSEVAVIALLAVPAGVSVATLFLPWYALRVSGVDMLVFLGPLGAVWLLVGGLVLRGRVQPTRA